MVCLFFCWYGASVYPHPRLARVPQLSQAEKHPLKHEATAKKFAERQKTRVLAPSLDDQFSNGRMLARLTSRPGQTGRLDGYVLEGRELDFYVKKLAVKKSKK